MIYGAKLSECWETVIAAMAAHIEHLEVDLEMKERANTRLREEVHAKEIEYARAEETIAKLEEQLCKVKDFCAGEIAKSKSLNTPRNRPAEFVKTAADFKKASDAVEHLGKTASETVSGWINLPSIIGEVAAKTEFSADPFEE